MVKALGPAWDKDTLCTSAFWLHLIEAKVILTSIEGPVLLVLNSGNSVSAAELIRQTYCSVFISSNMGHMSEQNGTVLFTFHSLPLCAQVDLSLTASSLLWESKTVLESCNYFIFFVQAPLPNLTILSWMLLHPTLSRLWNPGHLTSNHSTSQPLFPCYVELC